MLARLATAQEHDIPLGKVWRLRWNPSEDLYPRYVADPRRSRHIMSIASAFDSGIPGSGDLRWGLCIGGDYPMARLFQEGREQLGWQFNAEARFYTQFDIENDLDELGHDGRLGMIISRAVHQDVALRFTFHHTSSHVGDEYMLRNQVTERLSARKEEAGAGVSWRLSNLWRTYAEFGYGLNLGVRNEPLRVQSGLEYQSRPILASGRWYAALDLSSFEENGWELSTNLQTGLVFPFPRAGRAYRLGLELYHGRAQLDSFFLYRESYIVLGTWLDL